MTETLQDLTLRRMKELAPPDGKPLSGREIWHRGGDKAWSYETVRQLINFGRNPAGDRLLDALAKAIDVPVSEVLTAAGQRLDAGKFTLPKRADRLTQSERVVILSMIDAILAASKADRGEH